MVDSDNFRTVVEKAVSDVGAEEVGRQIGVSGEQVRQYLADPNRKLRAKEAAKYGVWIRGRNQQSVQGWEPAVFLAGYAEAILGMMEDATTRQRVLVERLRSLRPEAAMPQVVSDVPTKKDRVIPAYDPAVVEKVRATNAARAEEAKRRRDGENRPAARKSAGT